LGFARGPFPQHEHAAAKEQVVGLLHHLGRLADSIIDLGDFVTA
jgi:hypothetical protein